VTDVDRAYPRGKELMTVKVKWEKGDPPVVAHVLGRRVRARCADLGYSQGDLASLMRKDRGHPWNAGTVSRVQSGVVEPSLSELVSLMFVLGSSFEELTDPTVTSLDRIDVGLSEPQPAEYVRGLLSGEHRVHYGRTRRP
jgi:transcriptional regulator with XRE-family HTH domain